MSRVSHAKRHVFVHTVVCFETVAREGWLTGGYAVMGIPINRRSSKNETVSPILEQIMTGGSSVSFNVLQISQNIEKECRLFHIAALNNCMVFKYPNFNDEQEKKDEIVDDVFVNDMFVRPIETGLYIPHNTEAPRGGGYGMYLRSKNYRNLLAELFGVSNHDFERAASHDLAILDAIDSVPSLDAFLLKTCFETSRISVDPRYLKISPEEDTQIRLLIGGRIEPIIRKALGVPDGVGQRVERFLQAIWQSDLPEARLFVTAFGIEQSEADYVFSAWKGITYYEFQLRRIAPAARNIVKWLKSSDSLPIDLRSHKMYEPNLLMYIERVGKQIENALNDIRSILSAYEHCFHTLMIGQPAAFRDFLRNVRQKYWLMGYCISALNSLCHTFSRFMRQSVDRRLFFESMFDMLRQFDVALDRRREQRMSF